MLQGLSRFVTFVAVVAVLVAVGCQTGRSSAASRSGGDARQEISTLLDQYSQALMNKDLATLDRIWADDLSFVNLRGELLTKQNRMDNIKTGATAIKTTRLSDVRVRLYGDAAVATCKVSLEAQYSGQEGSGDYRVTTVWARPKGTWQMVAVQMTRIAP
jgi:ketosteroid isomerase-like protein